MTRLHSPPCQKKKKNLNVKKVILKTQACLLPRCLFLKELFIKVKKAMLMKSCILPTHKGKPSTTAGEQTTCCFSSTNVPELTHQQRRVLIFKGIASGSCVLSIELPNIVRVSLLHQLLAWPHILSGAFVGNKILCSENFQF